MISPPFHVIAILSTFVNLYEAPPTCFSCGSSSAEFPVDDISSLTFIDQNQQSAVVIGVGTLIEHGGHTGMITDAMCSERLHGAGAKAYSQTTGVYIDVAELQPPAGALKIESITSQLGDGVSKMRTPGHTNDRTIWPQNGYTVVVNRDKQEHVIIPAKIMDKKKCEKYASGHENSDGRMFCIHFDFTKYDAVNGAPYFTEGANGERTLWGVTGRLLDRIVPLAFKTGGITVTNGQLTFP